MTSLCESRLSQELTNTYSRHFIHRQMKGHKAGVINKQIKINFDRNSLERTKMKSCTAINSQNERDDK